MMLGMVKDPPLGYFISTHIIICNLWSESPYKQVHLSSVTSTHAVMYKAKGNFPFCLPVLSCEMRLSEQVGHRPFYIYLIKMIVWGAS